eukprot:112709_1
MFSDSDVHIIKQYILNKSNSKNYRVLELKAVLLRHLYGRGAFFICYQASHSCVGNMIPQLLRLANAKDKLCVINDKIIWFPLDLIEILHIDSNSMNLISYYPTSIYITVCALAISQIQEDKMKMQVQVMALPSYEVLPSFSYEIRLNNFLQNAINPKQLKFASKIGLFKTKFPFLYKELKTTNKYMPYEFDLRRHSWISIWDSTKNYFSDYAQKLEMALYKINFEDITMTQFVETAFDYPFTSKTISDNKRLCVNGLQNNTEKEKQFSILLSAIISYVSINALTRVMISMYGSKCSYCNHIGKKFNRFKVCKYCKIRFYCSRSCQKKDWIKIHRKYCNIHHILGKIWNDMILQ